MNPSRRSLIAWMGLASAGCAGVPSAIPSAIPSAMPSAIPSAIPSAVPSFVKSLAPTGRLRACINLGNPILARLDGSTAVGVSVDLSRALATQLGVELELLIVDAASKSVEAVSGGGADIGFFAVDPLRSKGIAFSAPYLLIEGAYLVRQHSALTDNAQVDRPGHRIMVGKGSAYDLHLSREIRSAELLRAPTSPKVVDAFLAENADVAAGVRQQLEADAARLPGLRLLPGRFMVIAQTIGLPAGRGELAERTLRAFVEQVKASGWVARALARHSIQGASVAPAA